MLGCGNDSGGGQEAFWADVNIKSFDSLPKLEALQWEKISPEMPPTYWELRNSIGFDLLEVIGSDGNKCGTADDPEQCKILFDNLKPSEFTGFAPSCLPTLCLQYIASNTGNENKLWTTIGELKVFLGNIDTAEEALLLAHAEGYHWHDVIKQEGAIRQIDGAYELVVLKGVSDCTPIQTNRFLIRIDIHGNIQILREQVFNRIENACV